MRDRVRRKLFGSLRNRLGLGARSRLAQIIGHGGAAEEAEIVMRIENIVPDQPASGAPNQNIGGKVLFRNDAADADTGGSAIYRRTGQPAGVFFADN